MPAYRSPRALEMAIKEAAKASPLDTNDAIRNFYFHRLLCRVFSERMSVFVLKGGLGILARTIDARSTRDIDLATDELGIDEAVSELERLASKDMDDFVRFTMRDVRPIKVEDDYSDRAIDCVIVDPSASSFIALIRKRHKIKVRKAKNDVLKGIQDTATALTEGYVKVCAEACPNTTREFGLYVWSDKPSDKDKVVKENDHAMDALRYGVETMELYEKKNDYVPLMQRQRLRPLGRGLF